MTRTNGALKAKRQQAILSLVARERLGSQDEIRSRLSAMGIAATQSTISRDIEELGLARLHDHDGTRYVEPGAARSPQPVAMLRRLLDEFALSMVRADHGLVDIAGTIAGDNTILILGREGIVPSALERSLTQIMEAT